MLTDNSLACINYDLNVSLYYYICMYACVCTYSTLCIENPAWAQYAAYSTAKAIMRLTVPACIALLSTLLWNIT